MTRPIIRVEDLGKEFVIGGPAEPYSTIRESIVRTVRKPYDMILGNGSERWKFWALKDVSFEVFPGEVLGIIGRNGAGKSTLLKVLSRITEPTKGRVELYGRVGSLLEVGTGFHPELTGRENIYLNGAILGMRRDEIAKKFDAIVDFAEIEEFLDTPVKRYSSGMYTRLAFAVAANLEPEILIVDEVLAVGDAAFQKKCLGKMEEVASAGRTVLFVSHNMGAVSKLCSEVMLLQNGKVRGRGEPSDIVGQYLREGSSSEFVSDTGPVRFASLRQIGQRLILKLRYHMEKEIDLPCLGFVVSDAAGNPLFGTNPKIDKVPRLTTPRSEGDMEIEISEPGLVDGTYYASLWFGDGETDHFVEKDCLTLEVLDMVPNQHGRPHLNGFVYPRCEWNLNA